MNESYLIGDKDTSSVTRRAFFVMDAWCATVLPRKLYAEILLTRNNSTIMRLISLASAMHAPLGDAISSGLHSFVMEKIDTISFSSGVLS